MAFGRTSTSVSTSSWFVENYKKTVGHKFRDFIASCGHYIKPFKKYFLPNFIAVHYFYIISLTILGSILMYPVHNFRYIDILFLACGATTQGGLNTVNVNDLTLYQQLIIYLLCCISTPIAIHGCLAFVRLYWFERYFDGIKDRSKRNFKMRRTRTILQREMTKRSHQATHTFNARTYSSVQTQRSNAVQGPNAADPDFQEKLFSGRKVNRDEQSFHSEESQDTNLPDRMKIDNSSGSSTGDGTHYTETSSSSTNHAGERFASRRNSTDITPVDMYRSIMMFRGQHQDQNEEGEGPALVIKGRNVASDIQRPKHKPLLQDIQSVDEGDESSTEETSQILRPKSLSSGINSQEDRPTLGETHVGGQDSNSIYTDSDDMNHTVDDEVEPPNASAISSQELELFEPGSDVNFSNRSINNHSVSDSNISSENVRDYRGSDYDDDNTGDDGNDEISDDEAESLDDSLSSGSQTDANTPLETGPLEYPDNTQHISFSNDDETRRQRGVTVNQRNRGKLEDSSVRPKEGQSIQFNITARPKRRYQIQGAKKARNPYYHTKKRPAKRLLLKQLKKGKRLREQLQGRLSRATTDKDDYPDNFSAPSTDPRPRAEILENKGNNDMEEYFADDETDEDIPYDISPEELNRLSQTPDFQKMIYKNWKAKHRKTGKLGKASRTLEKTLTSGSHSNFPRPRRNHHLSNDFHKNKPNNGDAGNLSSDDSYGSVLDSERGTDYYNYIDTEDQAQHGNHFEYNFDQNNLNLPLNRTMSTNYLSWQPTIGRNSTFVGLSKSQRDELGGVEYRAIKLLCKILLCYYFGFHVMAFVMMVPWICVKKYYIHIVRSDGVSPAWWGFFTSMSAFSDLGLTVTPDSMTSFNKAIYPQIVMMWFIIIGNTGFPILLRCIIWVMFKTAPELSQTKESLGFLLDHPRRCFTLLFPEAATWWLLLTLLFLNITDWILFIILDMGSAVLKPLSRGLRVLNGLFQAVSTRTAGFSIVDLSKLHPAIQVSYMLMMYVSVLPVAISIRRTNVYEERSLGMYGKIEEHDDEDEDVDSSDTETKTKKSKKRKNRNNLEEDDEKKDHVSTKSFIGAHLRKQLSFDLWFLFLGLFVICLCENSKIQDTTRPNFNVFSILFEIVSAYGTIGLSLGYPETNQSFSAQFTSLSKLVIILMLIRGRCRGLPYSLDRAIILPSDRLEHIDHMEDLKLRKNHGRAETIDPVTEYVKHSTGVFRKKLERFNTHGHIPSHIGPSDEFEMTNQNRRRMEHQTM
ncbi:Trk1p KNAG_0C02700 [Huiozyma naganishii CBS 8797]|uniref:Potassium transport protein n=1 Tax=Huiozyma naganishii (strain ATCC MYA-139 / BCRC 22969 / CBS 8797 / KCTC 17520 / NBRC 10181 / NCYC 3082 / Yp74L-3) TaxID=1071383 RepID=J7S5U8_HUIN7|nr:hypothetical protein KNAG_0C02700 [Kazachstania naganishii CBS 8797]CCK69381.1 hypothetical protein KNAG_0C02700 [Kazachstania naganishii CBS 8797]